MSDEDDKEEGILYDKSVEFIVHDKGNFDEEDENGDDKEMETENASVALLCILGMCLALDEMMVRFSGWSMETHCIKDKPIGEGYKLFTLSTTAGYVVNFTPDDRTAAKSQQQEYKTVNSTGKIESMILHV
eukprot:679184-Ditylum_brightwellii.AAC.1